MKAANGPACYGCYGVEVLQLAQIPQLYGRIRGASREVIAIFRKREARDGPLVTLEGRHIRLGLHIPNPHDRFRPSAQDEPIGMEAGA